MWRPEDAELYLEQRVALHQSAKDKPDDKLPPCTDEERWLDKTGKYRRCEEYCEAFPYCCQVKAELAKQETPKKKKGK
jgi:hypothetical protein